MFDDLTDFASTPVKFIFDVSDTRARVPDYLPFLLSFLFVGSFSLLQLSPPELVVVLAYLFDRVLQMNKAGLGPAA